MDRSAAYVHALNGRLRIKIPELKGKPWKAQEIEDYFDLMTGMREVSASPLTGSLLFIYDPHLLRQEDIFASLKELGYFHGPGARQGFFSSSAPDNHGIVGTITSSLASGLMEFALTRLVSALI